jgi:hypothetical protein
MANRSVVDTCYGLVAAWKRLQESEGGIAREGAELVYERRRAELGRFVPNANDSVILTITLGNESHIIEVYRFGGGRLVTHIKPAKPATSMRWPADPLDEPLPADDAEALRGAGWGQALPVSDEVTP